MVLVETRATTSCLYRCLTRLARDHRSQWQTAFGEVETFVRYPLAPLIVMLRILIRSSFTLHIDGRIRLDTVSAF
jgi:hypothetical protein